MIETCYEREPFERDRADQAGGDRDHGARRDNRRDRDLEIESMKQRGPSAPERDVYHEGADKWDRDATQERTAQDDRDKMDDQREARDMTDEDGDVGTDRAGGASPAADGVEIKARLRMDGAGPVMLVAARDERGAQQWNGVASRTGGAYVLVDDEPEHDDGALASQVVGLVGSGLMLDERELRDLLVRSGWVPSAPTSIRMTYMPKRGVANPTQGVVNFHGPGGQTSQVLYEHEVRAIAVALGIDLEERS